MNWEANSNRLARLLDDLGLRPGDHLAVLATNKPRVFDVYWAAMRSGLYVTMVNRHLTGTEAAYIVDDCGARALIVDAALADIAERDRDEHDRDDHDSELAAELLEYLGTRVARYKLPRRILFSRSLPRTPAGKLIKRELTASLS